MSSGIVALVTALDPLSLKLQIPPCPTCSNVGAAVRGFQTLLDAVVKSNTEAKDQFYRLRSRIAHGAWLLRSDFSARGGGSQARLEEFDLHRIERQ